MRGLLAPRVRNDSPVPLVSRAVSGIFSGMFQRRDAAAQLDMMSTSGTVYGVVNRTSTAVAKTEWHLYRKPKSGKEEDRVEITSHAALDLINKPNPFYTRMELFEVAQQHLDLPGEACLVVGRNERFRNLPLELWPVRPDRIEPVPHPEKYLSGWMYISPDGERVPLRTDEVIHIRIPNPMDPYRGLGPVGSVLTEVMSAHYAAEWNANFFRNSAEPGGIIEVEKRLSDEEFDEMSVRWEEQHRGVARAHRVAILEQGKWVDRKYTQRDMEFSSLRGVTRDAILEAYGFPKAMLGITEDVNRANAEAGELVFARWLTVPRLDRWRDVLNAKFLPLYGATAEGLEFDYDSPVPADEEADNAERTSKADAAQKLIAAGYDGDSVKDALELPDALVWEKPAPQPAFGHLPAEQQPAPAVGSGSTGPTPAGPDAPQPPAPPADNATVGGQLAALRRTITGEPAPAAAQPDAITIDVLRDLFARALDLHPDQAPVRNVTEFPVAPDGWAARDESTVNAYDLGPVQAAWESACAALAAQWNESVVADWIRQLIAAIRTALGGDRAELAALTVDIDPAVKVLADAMAGLAETAAGHAVDEAATADVTLTPQWPTSTDLADAARQVAEFEARRYALTAGREAARVAGPDSDIDDVTGHVETFLAELSDASTQTALGGALTDAQNTARLNTLRSGPVGALYASEVNDSNRCKPCAEIHGRFIATTDDLAALYKLYPTGGYIDCLGRWRCRGTYVGVWRPATTEGGQ